MDEIRGPAYDQSGDENLFDEIFEEFSGIEPVDVHKYGEEEVDEPEVEEVDPAESVTKMFHEPVDEDLEDGEFHHILKRGYGSEDVDFDGNVGVEFSEGADSITDKAEQLEKVNQQLKSQGVRRQYVMSDVDAPDLASVYEDSIGKYFYRINARARPSDITKVMDIDSRFELSEKGRVLATVVLLGKSFPWVVHDADSPDKVDSFLERALITEVDELEKEDVFSLDEVEAVREVLLNR